MRALTFQGVEAVGHESVPDPRIEDPRDAIVRVECAGICGSELSGYLGHNALRVPPLVMGHEFSGEIVELGPQARAMIQVAES